MFLVDQADERAGERRGDADDGITVPRAALARRRRSAGNGLPSRPRRRALSAGRRSC